MERRRALEVPSTGFTHPRASVGVAAALGLGAAALLVGVVLAHPGFTVRVSVGGSGGFTSQANDTSFDPSISADGRFVAFESHATNLVTGDTGWDDIFVHDPQTATTTRVSVGESGAQANSHSDAPSISADGRYVAFRSAASNLVTGDTNATPDVFFHDRQTANTTRVSVTSAGVQANNTSDFPSISADSRFVAFSSFASNLVEGDTNGNTDVFVHDRLTPGATTRVSVTSAGVQANGFSSAPSIGADGRFVAFYSAASNLVEGDTNAADDVFVHDRQTASTTRVSVTSAGVQANGASGGPSISADGRFVAFHSLATDLVAGDTNGQFDVFVHDRQTASTTRVSVTSAGVQANGLSGTPSISADGRFVAFRSSATDLVAGDTNAWLDVFVHDRHAASTTRVSVTSAAAQANGSSLEPSMSADGRFVAFRSAASDLVEFDTNGADDVFVHDLHMLHLADDHPFTDIDASPFITEIAWLEHMAITLGCNPPTQDRFCPTDTVSRQQMASFLARAKDLPTTTNDYFVDDEGSPHEDDINRLRLANITQGCNPPTQDRFCPTGIVSRQEMASFIARAMALPTTETDYFTDDTGSPHEADINRMRAANITNGCNPPDLDRFCPTSPVTREQMAAFLYRAMAGD